MSTLVLSRLFLYITEIILIATINNFDVEEGDAANLLI
ncbi:hypothetical protein FORC82_2761 [Escherichia coli]|nr:conserved hypothetical protein [Escherichia coli 101-1]QAZ72452.1 hypothetical protein FORC82_2761 [Escherichia coli]CCQ02445.1 FIG00638885: hypothetical protein [Escherichia coli O5:K4(L):H4 str. ATCC 23502]